MRRGHRTPSESESQIASGKRPQRQPAPLAAAGQIRHEITVVAAEESAARADALLETRRTSGSGKPWWEPSPSSLLAHARQSDGFAVMAIEPALEVVAVP